MNNLFSYYFLFFIFFGPFCNHPLVSLLCTFFISFGSFIFLLRFYFPFFYTFSNNNTFCQEKKYHTEDVGSNPAKGIWYGFFSFSFFHYHTERIHKLLLCDLRLVPKWTTIGSQEKQCYKTLLSSWKACSNLIK